MSNFDTLPNAPLPMPKQTLETDLTLNQRLTRFFRLFVRDPSTLRREY